MRQFPPGLATQLSSPATTLAHCWRLTRRDGMVLGFTDHDEALTFAGTRFDAATGLVGTEAEETLGLAAPTREVEGALSSAAIDETDIRAGRFDAARIETFVVDWQNPDDFVLMDVAELGEVKHGEIGFAAELRGIAAQLDWLRGRIYRRRCDAVFGDTRCRIAASDPPYSLDAIVSGGEGETILISGDLGGSPGLFDHGRVAFVDGAAMGLASDIVSAGDSGAGTVRLALSQAIEASFAPGDRLRLTQGCDKRFATCRGRFANGENFRGFPHMPGSDAALAVAKADGIHDGSPVVP